MSIKSDAAIYKIIEQHLKASKDPLSSTDLWAHDDVRANARSPEKVSDYLGLMWRRGILQRWHTPKTSASRALYAYSWNTDEPARHEPVVALKPLSAVPQTYKKSNVVITEEENRIVLDFDKFTLTIQAKG